MNDDLISRDASLDACSQSINILDAMSRIEDLPSVKPNPCEDSISRQASIKLFLGKVHDEYPVLSDVMIGILESLPPVTLKQRTGHWIIIDDCERFIAKCSECGRIEDSRMINKYPYCHCGAKMVEPQEGEEV